MSNNISDTNSSIRKELDKLKSTKNALAQLLVNYNGEEANLYPFSSYPLKFQNVFNTVKALFSGAYVLEIPNYITKLSNNAFANRHDFKEIKAENVIVVGDGCFDDCTYNPVPYQYESVSFYLPNLIKAGASAFAYTGKSGTSITYDFPKLEEVGGSCFAHSFIEKIIIPNVSVISVSCFEYSDFASHSFEYDFSSVQELSNYAFKNTTGNFSLSFPKLKKIGQGCFQDSRIMEFSAPLLEELEQECFSGSYIKKLTFNNIEQITSNVFLNAFKLKSIDFWKLKRIMSHSISSCSELTELIIRTDEVCTLEPYGFSRTPINDGNGFIYVPDNLVESYKVATNWSDYANQIKPISELEE